jgi:hypothetical protein
VGEQGDVSAAFALAKVACSAGAVALAASVPGFIELSSDRSETASRYLLVAFSFYLARCMIWTHAWQHLVKPESARPNDRADQRDVVAAFVWRRPRLRSPYIVPLVLLGLLEILDFEKGRFALGVAALGTASLLWVVVLDVRVAWLKPRT